MKITVQSNLMVVIGAVTMGALNLMPMDLAMATGRTCSFLFESHEDSFYASEIYRAELLGYAQNALSNIRKERTRKTAEFQIGIERRDEVSSAVLQSEIASSPTLAATVMGGSRKSQENSFRPPAIDKVTLEMIMDPGVRHEVIFKQLSQDSYFQWLKHNALSYSLEQNDNLKAMLDSKGQPRAQIDPILLFLVYRNDGMRPELALLRLMRNLDPVVSVSGFHAAQQALVHEAFENTLTRLVIPHLVNRETLKESDAWRLMPSLLKGRQNFRKLLDEQRAYHGEKFPRRSFERIIALTRARDPEMNIISIYHSRRESGRTDAQIMTELDTSLNALKKHLGLPGTFPTDRLYETVMKVLKPKSNDSYESILADIFDPATGKLIRELRTLLEIADGFSQTKIGGSVDNSRLVNFLFEWAQTAGQ